MRKTPLADHLGKAFPRLGAFAGWEMPLFFSSAAEEHLAVRQSAGIFDISHMGQVFCEGLDAADFLNRNLTNDVSKLKIRRSHYSFLLNESGGVIDDLLLYRLSKDSFFIIFNSSKVDEALALLQPKTANADVNITQRLDHIGLALQGPHIAKLAPELIGTTVPEKRNHLISPSADRSKFDPADTIIATTGYTGEHGFEWFGPAEEGIALWNKALSLDVAPCGLVARDSLRLEAGLPLNGQDLSPAHTPNAAGLNFAVKLNKEPTFPGKSAHLSQQTAPPAQQLHGFTLNGPGPIPRTGQTIHASDGQLIATVSSGGRPPTQKQGIGLAWFDTNFLASPSEAHLLVREKSFPISLKKTPFT